LSQAYRQKIDLEKRSREVNAAPADKAIDFIKILLSFIN